MQREMLNICVTLTTFTWGHLCALGLFWLTLLCCHMPSLCFLSLSTTAENRRRMGRGLPVTLTFTAVVNCAYIYLACPRGDLTTKLTFYIDLAVRDGPLLSALQQVVHPSVWRTHCDPADLFWEKPFLWSHLNRLHRKVFYLFGNISRDTQRVVAHPLVDGLVLAMVKPLLEVEHPRGRAGVDVVVVEHTIHCHVVPRSRHHFFRDVAHSWTHTHTQAPDFVTKHFESMRTH